MRVASSSFNPKREARLSQTEDALSPDEIAFVSIPNGKPGPLRRYLFILSLVLVAVFQSQTGSQALSDAISRSARRFVGVVSIPNGKPGPLRPSWREASRHRKGRFQSQTGSQALSDL